MDCRRSSLNGYTITPTTDCASPTRSAVADWTTSRRAAMAVPKMQSSKGEDFWSMVRRRLRAGEIAYFVSPNA